MSDRTLRGCRILVVEDEYMLADELKVELEQAGAIVLGPVSSAGAAIEIIEGAVQLDGAILDINLGDEMVCAVADRLLEETVPFLFATGYDAAVVPDRYASVVRCEKPLNLRRVVEVLGREIEQ
ncbi:response regulator [Novosphingobium sp. PC22D]|uniref:response regulator n=1 Tax=Novosphingobium sp. PC22D TaxID=1962403 RepID=UPI000BEFF542|nr:response regulator [Novosphingobium sp. PC22D]PEQ10566.1 response regulator [Novosphingobium sp. PC22D]